MFSIEFAFFLRMQVFMYTFMLCKLHDLSFNVMNDFKILLPTLSLVQNKHITLNGIKDLVYNVHVLVIPIPRVGYGSARFLLRSYDQFNICHH